MTHNDYIVVDQALTAMSHALTYELREVQWPANERYFQLRDDVLEYKRELYRGQARPQYDTSPLSVVSQDDAVIAALEEAWNDRERPWFGRSPAL